MIPLFKLYSFIFGALWGSFFNVVILRVPAKQDFIFKKSHCPKCKSELKWYDNIPLLSMLWLKFRCRNCKVKISYQYFFIELICGIAAVFLFPKFLSLNNLIIAFILFLIFCLLLSHFIIDLRHFILPDGINIALLVLFALLVFLEKGSWSQAFWGFVIGLGFPWAIAEFFYRFRGVEGLGGGDIKLFAVLGFYVGFMDILYILVFSSFLGAIVSILLIASKKMTREDPIPFGPAIILIGSLRIYFPHTFEQITRFLFPM